LKAEKLKRRTNLKTVVGLFDTYAHAETAARDLENAGISHSDISLVANNTNGQFDQNADTTPPAPAHPAVGSETSKGAVAGGVAGLLLGLAAFAIPGLGAVAAVGWLTTTITGVVVGAGVGLAGALIGVGVPHEDAAYYTEGVRRGGTLLAVRAPDDQADHVAQILGDDGAINIDERAEQYRREGFVPGATVASTLTPGKEANIDKQAYVVEEVVINKETTRYPETVRDTIRRTDVEAEPLTGAHAGRTVGYDAYENDFRNNWRTNYGNQGGTYEDYNPAYQYGYGLTNEARYRGRDWNSIQSDVQRDWETRQPGTWDRFKNSVRYAWDKGTGAERGGIKTGGHDLDGTPDTRGITEKIADTVTGDRIDDKTGKPV
jgi:hypothetical protein